MQRRRELTVRATQAMQQFMHRQLLARAMETGARPSLPPVMRIAMRIPGLRAMLPRLVALGIQRPRVESPEIALSAAAR